jgi:hypothetical protein
VGPKADPPMPTWIKVRSARGVHLFGQGLRGFGDFGCAGEAHKTGQVLKQTVHGLFETGAEVAQLRFA